MSVSAQYYSLLRRIVVLRKNLLPDDLDDPFAGISDPQGEDRTLGFIVLVHAEIEHYLEMVCQELAKASVEAYTRQQSVGRVVFSLYAICASEWSELGKRPENLKKPCNEVGVETRINMALQEYLKVVSNNNGIKEENLKWLLVPLSIRLNEDLDDEWKLAMNEFGGMRGNVAHMSRNKITFAANPKDIYNTVRSRILTGLKKLDIQLANLIPIL